MTKLNNNMPGNVTNMNRIQYNDQLILTIHITVQKSFGLLLTYIGDAIMYLKADNDKLGFEDHLRLFLNSKNASNPVTYDRNYRVFFSGEACYVR